MADENTPKEDLFLVGPEVGDNGARRCLRYTDGVVSTGTLAPAREGQPIHDELVKLTQRGSSPIYDAESVYKPERSGPSNVNSRQFQTGWDRIFGSKTVGVA